ncbi:helix-turn-helix domain-containing protein [Sinorhizobium fredii]
MRKYENGRTKVSASRLQAIANALKYRSHLLRVLVCQRRQ